LKKTSRAIFKFNQGLDKTLFKPIAKGYLKLPRPVKKASGNFVNNLSSLLTLPNNLLQGDVEGAGNTLGRFVLNSTVGVFGLFDPASSLGAKPNSREDFGQTLGVHGMDTGCYFMLPVLGPTTARDFVGKIGDTFLDPVYMVTKGDSEILNRSYSEHSYYYYKGVDATDFRSKNVSTFDNLEKNSIDLYASVKSLYLQNRKQKISNSKEKTDTLDDSDWQEIDSK
jgi:phospholipid-binding lipoprotein MlaA